MEFEIIPLGPLSPLRALAEGKLGHELMSLP
jgi:hypothetical protein